MERLNCPFCSPGRDEILMENKFAYARYDKYPVNPGHILIIPHRHVSNLFEASPEELGGLWDIVQHSKLLLEEDYSPNGFNIGVNIGQAAGQTVMHLHVHLIPRYTGDIPDPRGGMRGVIPEKRIYPDNETAAVMQKF